MKLPCAPVPRFSAFKAFTLVETVISIGIISFVLTSLMGVLSVALSDIGQAQNDVVVADIATGFLDKASQADFTGIDQLDGGDSLFDVSGATTTDANRAIYYAQMKVETLSAHSRKILVSVFRQPRGASNDTLAIFVSVVSDNGR